MSDSSAQLGRRLHVAGELDEILRRGLVRSVFQPIVDLDSGSLFGFEALARGPGGSSLEHPAQLFGAARAEGKLAELDHACQCAAIAGAHRHRLAAPLTLFVNAEPYQTGFGPLPPIRDGVRAVVELTEHSLTNGLPELLPAVQRARTDDWGIAFDNVGADSRSLALLAVLQPDVIKLDLRLLKRRPAPEVAAIAAAVGAQAERTGATVLAEGIESPADARHAQALGATLGQGFHFGDPTEQPRRVNVTSRPLALLDGELPQAWRTPFDLASSDRAVRQGTTPLLAAISRELERRAARGDRASLLIKDVPQTLGRQPRLEIVVGELGGLRASARAVAIADDDPLRGTWNVLVISAHFASMLAAREHRQTAHFDQPQFDFVVTYDRDLIVECAQALLLRGTAATAV